MAAAGAVGIILTLVLAFSPSAKVNATRTTVPLYLENSDLDDQFERPTLAITKYNEPLQNERNTRAQKTKLPDPLENWQTFTVKNGHTLSLLFAKAGFDDSTMYGVLGSSKSNKALSRIYPGEKIGFLVDEQNRLLKVKLERSALESLVLSKQDDGEFESQLVNRTPEIHAAYGEGVIDSSLFLAGQKAGLSEAQIMELANIFGWDIDFVLDIRQGDHFKLVYEELYLDGEKLKNGKILAASFTNNGRTLDAVLYKQPSGESNYFTPEGESMRKAFIRTPVDFARISSRFNLKRRHPVLHKIRAHKGTDYAASTGTPVKATGDGKVIHAYRKGGYGNAVIIQHGQKITTLYAHLSKFARGVRSGKRVKQGQVIGYIGSTGLATGPHLHYEFRVNGVHKNSLKVKLPHASPVPKKEFTDFKLQTQNYMAQLTAFSESYQLASK